MHNNKDFMTGLAGRKRQQLARSGTLGFDYGLSSTE
jgi:hypothetical protein